MIQYLFLYFFLFSYYTDGVINISFKKPIHRIKSQIRADKKYPLSTNYYASYIKRISGNSSNGEHEHQAFINKYKRRYTLTNPDFQEKIKRLNSKNSSIQNREILGEDDVDDFIQRQDNNTYYLNKDLFEGNITSIPGIRIIISKQGLADFDIFNRGGENEEDNDDADDYDSYSKKYGRRNTNRNRNKNDADKKSEHFEVITDYPISFKDIGGYDKVKYELSQCIDILTNYTKYAPYNVRVPKGLILEGPPGNGKTLLAKGLAGESKAGFIAVSGAEFQEKYVGVGPARIRELFELAKKNIPCIVFIDEIDALGRKRSSDADTASSERDNTLNELLVGLDGFKNTSGIFVIGATNRVDLLDPALIRPGRIDKRVFIGLPDNVTREAILNIHIKGKPHDGTVDLRDLVDLTMGLSGAQIENLLNEAMLTALRGDRKQFTYGDIDAVLNKIIAGWQPSEHQFTTDIIDHIAIHEMGHAIVGLLCKHHAKMTKVIINLSSPNSPGYTVFESSTSNIYTREALFEHLMILLAGRIAEEVVYDVSVTTGAINDFEEALKLSQKMIIYYGMGKKVIYPNLSDKYKELIDTDVIDMLHEAYRCAHFIVQNSKELLLEAADILKRDKLIKADKLINLINNKYPHILELNEQ
jgi:cell division protease FtsH